jgi:hypothetical protein
LANRSRLADGVDPPLRFVPVQADQITLLSDHQPGKAVHHGLDRPRLIEIDTVDEADAGVVPGIHFEQNVLHTLDAEEAVGQLSGQRLGYMIGSDRINTHASATLAGNQNDGDNTHS